MWYDKKAFRYNASDVHKNLTTKTGQDKTMTCLEFILSFHYHFYVDLKTRRDTSWHVLS